MKIRKVTPDHFGKVAALLRQAFPGGNSEVKLVEALRNNNRLTHEWMALHTNRVIAYLAFSNAYDGTAVIGLHLAPLAVKPEFQGQGVGSELMRFALRQKEIKEWTVFVLGEEGFYRQFGFERCQTPLCPFDSNNAHFLSLRNAATTSFVVGYEPEFGQ